MNVHSIYGTATGKKHSESAIEGMDKISQAILEIPLIGKVYLYALADGAGSSEFGGVSAQIAVQNYIKAMEVFFRMNIFLSEDIIRTHMKRAFQYARDMIFANLINQEQDKMRPNNCHTTLIGACIIIYNTKVPPLVCFAGVGDGVVICRYNYCNEQRIDSILPITKGEYENQTLFITSAEWAQAWYFSSIKNCNSFFISSDGFNYIYFNQKIKLEIENAPRIKRYQWEVYPSEKYLERLWEQLSLRILSSYTLKEQLLLDSRIMDINDDDKSLILGVIEDLKDDDYQRGLFNER